MIVEFAVLARMMGHPSCSLLIRFLAAFCQHSSFMIILTGCAGFIGSHVLERLLAEGHRVFGVDNFDVFYERELKEENLAAARQSPSFDLLEGDLAETETMARLAHALDSAGEAVEAIIHLAARAGVRPSIADPAGYQVANVVATQNLLELARNRQIPQFVFASSSSVYGTNPRVPWQESDAVLQPISPYASTKVSGELMGHVYSHLFGIRFLALRFFTVYGPRQRPDLAINKFVRLIENGESIPVFGDGSTRRDYTFVGDIVAGILAAARYQQSSYEVINLGNNQTISLAEMIATIEKVLGKSARIDRQPEQPGDVPQTWASTEKAGRLLGYAPATVFETGLRAFVDWRQARAKA
jgi:UDP-glucuronate 4-epimerase